jgi:transposase
MGKMDDLCKRVQFLEIENSQLKIENNQLKERLNNNSSNSSLPPSKDFKQKKKKNNRASSGKKSGGQVGHPGHYRELLPLEKVDSIQKCEVATHCECGGEIKSSQESVRHQVYELPRLRLHVTEYQLQKGYCQCCGGKQVAALPKGVTWGITGVRLTAFMSDLISHYHLSRREQQTFLQEYFGFSISLGTVFNKQKRVNHALEAPVSELLSIVKESKSVHADETGHHREGKNQWMWGFISDTAAYFTIQASRGKKVLHSLMGDFKQIIISDRYAAYNDFPSDRRQLCWAHLKRDFTRLAEKEDKIISRIGKQLLEYESALFKSWHECKSCRITHDQLLRATMPLRRRIGELLEQGSYTDPTLKAARFCKNLLNHFNALWTFLEMEGVEPTNNHAERSLRPCVIWRKKYFCTRSDYGTEFVARSASINVTCRLQGKSPFKFLSELMQNYFAGNKTSAQILMT